MIPGVCPGCGLKADLDVFAIQADANRALAAALDLPPSLGSRVLSYLRLFSPPKKTLSLAKSGRLLTELAEAVRSASVSWNGVAHAAPLPLWVAALDAILANKPEVLPLTTHGYLFKVAWNLAEKSAATQERQQEARLRRGDAVPTPPPVSDAFHTPSSDAGSVSVTGNPSTPVEQAEAAFSSPNPERRARNAQAARELLQSVRSHLLHPQPQES